MKFKHIILVLFLFLSFGNSLSLKASNIVYKGSNQLDPPSWTWGNLGKRLGKDIFESVDLDNNGIKELIISNQNPLSPSQTSIFILENDLKTTRCIIDIQVHERIFDYQIAQLDDDPSLELLVVTNSSIIALNVENCQVELKLDFSLISPQNSVTAAGLGDINNDGTPEVVYSFYNDNEQNLYISEWNDLNSYIIKRGFAGSKIIVEPLGRESGDDIVVQSDVFTILHGETLETINEVHEQITSTFYVGDINGDNSYELITLSHDNNISQVFAYNIESGNTILSNNDFQIDSLLISDVNNDETDEIIIVGRDLVVLDGNNNVVHTINNYFLSGGVKVIMDNFTINSNLEVIGAGSLNLSRTNYLSGELLWSSLTQKGPYHIAGIDDYYLNGSDYLAVSFANTNTFSSSEYSGVAIIDDFSGSQQPNPYIESTLFNKISAVTSGNIDADPSIELCFATKFINTQDIKCVNPILNIEEWSIQPIGGPIVYLKILDINNDMSSELLAMAQGDLTVYDASNGTEIWRSPFLDGTYIYEGFNGVNIINGKIWISYPNGDIRKLNIETGEIIESIDESPVTHIVKNDHSIIAIFKNQGVGVLNPLDMSPIHLIYPTTDELVFLKESKDNQAILTATESNNFKTVTLISPTNIFAPKIIGNYYMYDSFIGDELQTYIATSNGVEKYDFVHLLTIFENGFE
jgi:outer membrane protein assembly factor BamB